VFARTTNPAGATADGLLLALNAGAMLADVEFVQFHPTALALAGAPALLVSEAARGEGAILVDASGRRFCFDTDPRGELAPRDIVARAIVRQLRGDPAGLVRLDLRPIGPPEYVRSRFPNIAKACARFGIDIGTTPVPVSPAAHYHMGGIRTDLWGRTSVAALYAIGECACTGLHGANRLASNSLAECLVFAARAADDVRATDGGGFNIDNPSAAPALVEAPDDFGPVATLLWNAAGVERDAAPLRAAIDALDAMPCQRRPISRAALEARSVLAAGSIIARAALMREESRGSHYRDDFTERDDARWRTRILWSSGGPSFEPVAAPVSNT
jgi:L-aspartate oxidase